MQESDWKVFRAMTPELRERYLREKNEELKGILEEVGKTPTERFWNAAEKSEEVARILRRCLDGHSRSKMQGFMAQMLQDGLLRRADLDKFSADLRERLSVWADCPL